VSNAHLLSVNQPLIPQQCQTLSQLLTQPQKLAEFLCDFEVQQPVKHCDDNEYPLEQAQQFDDALTDDALKDESNDADIQLQVDDELADSETPLSSAEQGEQQVLPSSSLCYQVYSRRYDNQVSAASLAPRLNYAALKAQILAELPEFAGLSRRLANKLRRHLLSLEQSIWQDELEEGYLNGARLSALVASPSKVRPFRQLIKQPLPKTAVTLLIDCSGSMKGKPLLMTAAWVDALVGALELCQVKIEVLGFTTGHWDDGPVFQQWHKCQSQSGSEQPGRLNDLLHVEFKRFDQPWRRARNGLAAVLESQWQKENIDGEALSWAYQRLKARAEHKKMLFVLSDAKPFEQLTGQNNGSQYLEQDLMSRVAEIEQDKQLELIGVGVGHRVSRVYPTSVQINQLSELPQVMLDTLIKQLYPSSLKLQRC
jgi:cobaltochelatase CobT